MADAPTIDELEAHLRVFSLPLGVTKAEVKERWQLLVQLVHPDKVPEALKGKATEEMIRINNSWEAINTWFKANPDAKATPEKEAPKKSAAAGDEKGSPGDDHEDEDDWENFEKKQRARWKSQDGVSLVELDRKRRHDMLVGNRRDAVGKAKVVGAVLLVMGGAVTSAHGAADLPFDMWTLTLIAYLLWIFHPKAKAKTEEWIERGE